DEARATLGDAGFEVTTTDQETADEEPGTVLAQSPSGGRAPEGSAVALTVARAPEQVAVPDVLGETQSDALRILQDAGFRVSPEQQAVEDLNQDDVVLDQDPAGGNASKPGDTVTITVGDFQPQDLNPDPEPEPEPGPADPAIPAP
ncbi:MAG: PASTA domain-containing protein, partial [Solirubrobacteraceae bacterium]